MRVGSVEQMLNAEPMPEAIATTLRAEPGSMAIAIRRVYRLTDGQLGEVAFNLHHADRFTYSVTLQSRG